MMVRAAMLLSATAAEEDAIAGRLSNEIEPDIRQFTAMTTSIPHNNARPERGVKVTAIVSLTTTPSNRRSEDLVTDLMALARKV